MVEEGSITPAGATPVDGPGQAERFCQYCGAKLNPAFYFCPGCATPYKPIDSVVPEVRPSKPTTGQLVRLKAPGVLTLVLTYIFVVLASAILGYILYEGRELGLVIIIQSAAMFVTTCIFAVRYFPALKLQLSKIGFLHWEAWASLLLLAPLLAMNYYYSGWLEKLSGGSGTALFDALRKSGFGEGSLIFFICVFPAVVEEIAFRGLVLHWLLVAIRPWLAIGFSALLFAGMHFSILSLPYLFLVGVLLGWARWKTSSLYPSMLIHFAHNFIVIKYFTT